MRDLVVLDRIVTGLDFYRLLRYAKHSDVALANHWQFVSVFNSLFRTITKKHQKHRILGPVTGGFPSQRASYESVSMSLRLYVYTLGSLSSLSTKIEPSDSNIHILNMAIYLQNNVAIYRRQVPFLGITLDSWFHEKKHPGINHILV